MKQIKSKFLLKMAIGSTLLLGTVAATAFATVSCSSTKKTDTANTPAEQQFSTDNTGANVQDKLKKDLTTFGVVLDTDTPDNVFVSLTEINGAKYESVESIGEQGPVFTPTQQKIIDAANTIIVEQYVIYKNSVDEEEATKALGIMNTQASHSVLQYHFTSKAVKLSAFFQYDKNLKKDLDTILGFANITKYCIEFIK